MKYSTPFNELLEGNGRYYQTTPACAAFKEWSDGGGHASINQALGVLMVKRLTSATHRDVLVCCRKRKFDRT